jgi:hypothetical protein
VTTLAQLTTPLTSAEVETAIYTGIAALGISTTDWKVGGPTRTMIAITAIVIAALSVLVSLIAAGGFLSTSNGPWLEVLAREVYNVTKGQGTFAIGSIQASNASGFAYAGGAGDLVVRNTTTTKTYASTGAWAIAPFAVGVDIPVKATEIGAASTSGPGSVTALVTALSGVTITNGTSIVGSDPPTDPVLKQECLDKTASLSPNGAPGAYRFVATTATRLADGSSIGVTRVRLIPDGIFGIDAYFATAAGTLPGVVGVVTTDLGRVDDLLQTQTVPEGITLRSHSATKLVIPITWTLWIRNTSGLTNPQIKTIVDNALTNYLANVPIAGETLGGPAPGKVYVSALEGVIARAVDLAIGNTGPTLTIRVSITAPGADVVVTATQAPVLGVSAGTINQISEGP